MRLSMNEVRANAAKFAKDWAGARSEKSETQTFYNDFFEIFGVKRRRVAFYEEKVKRLDNTSGFIDLFWPKMLLVEQKSFGRSLEKAHAQAEEYCEAIPHDLFPRYIMVCDFQNFELFDLDENEKATFTLAELPNNIEKFGFIRGLQKRTFKDQDPVNIHASELMGRIHDALENSGYAGHDLERFLVRSLFCLFADDTGIFEPRGIFEDLIRNRTGEDGAHVGPLLSQLFEVLNTPENKRQKNLDEDLAAFPYINGDLFAEHLRIPAFNSKMRKLLIEACEFSWEAISPAIFGSLVQSVMDKEQRRKQGNHYTTEKNILKVIEPLFLDDLRNEFKRIKARKTQRSKLLEKFQNKLASLKFFDPACGCGNFLVVSYRELRQLELEVLIEMRTDTTLQLDATTLSKVDVDQFYGIEIGEFPTRVAEVAMWMMDHIMNNQLSMEFGDTYSRIPLKQSPHVLCGDALEIKWEDILSPTDCSFILGNPPYIGAKLQSRYQRDQVRRIANLGGSGGSLDYVAAWFIKAGEYVRGTSIPIGFVATNSITQGEQVAQLWPLLFHRYQLEISFAHRTFAWGSDAKGKAHVHVVILGLIGRENEPKKKRLFSYDDIDDEPDESQHEAITAYLFDAARLKNRYLVLPSVGRPINGLPRLRIGSKPVDGGYFILSPEEREEIEGKYPEASKYIHPYVGSQEFLHGGNRAISFLGDASPNDIRRIPPFRKMIDKVREFRLGNIPAKSKKTIQRPTAGLLELAKTPRKFHVTVVPNKPFLVVPKVSSERRRYIPIGYMEPPVIPSDANFVLEGTDKTIFALLTSTMHMAWMRYFAGRLSSRYRYAIRLVYNPFPIPAMKDRQKIVTLADAVLDARAEHPNVTLANLYDPDLMPSKLQAAHTALDKAVDKIYRPKPFTSERERVEHLFQLYEEMVSPVEREAVEKKTRRIRKK